jgi:hypothetical protein
MATNRKNTRKTPSVSMVKGPRPQDEAVRVCPVCGATPVAPSLESKPRRGVAKKALGGKNLAHVLGKTALAGRITIYRIKGEGFRSVREDWFGPITQIDSTNWLYIQVRGGKHFPLPFHFFHELHEGIEVTNPANGERVKPNYLAFVKVFYDYDNARCRNYNLTSAECSAEELFEVYCIE